ncbi:MAG: TrkA family potassium uptake protein [Lachnospiraceae bacterium]|nr:TrkA family potassium uptake protein [Lachnospiraceae bacterium]
MKKNEKEFVVIGLGQFGTNVAKTLESSGATVMVIDKDDRKLERIANEVTHAVCADATNSEAMHQLGLHNYDGAIIGIGHDLEANVLITIQLKEMGVPFVMTKASTDLEGRILHKVGADKVIFPDKEMGYRVGNQIMNGNYFEAIELSEKYSIVDMNVPDSWVGQTLRGLNIRSKYGVNVIGIRGVEEMNINPHPTDELKDEDILIVLGHNTELQRLREMLG